MLKNLKISTLIFNFVYLLLGLGLLFKPGTSLGIICAIFGGSLVAFGAFQIIHYIRLPYRALFEHVSVFSGTLCLIVGVICLANPEMIVAMLPIVFGVFIIADGASQIVRGVKTHYVSCILTGVISVVFGIVLFTRPLASAFTITQLIGAVLTAQGVVHIIGTIASWKEIDRVQAEFDRAEAEQMRHQVLNGKSVEIKDKRK